jgi:hypothetical protein
MVVEVGKLGVRLEVAVICGDGDEDGAEVLDRLERLAVARIQRDAGDWTAVHLVENATGRDAEAHTVQRAASFGDKVRNPLGRGEGERVGGLRPGDDLEDESEVGCGARHRAWRVATWGPGNDTVPADATDGGSQAEDV